MSGPGSRFKGKHSLDSDEEDEEETREDGSKYEILDSDDVEGMYHENGWCYNNACWPDCQ